ncbi:MAG: YdcF family protein [Glaciimonas sp.]|nr:YdcF family protein [Glaciimonas sp.]
MQRLKLLILICLSCFLLATSAIVAAGLNDQLANADLIVVPGNAVARDGTPSPRLRARLDVALQLFQERRAPLIFVSGGTGKEGFDEAISMSNYLVKNGVPATAIIKDSMGIDTAATAKNAANFIRTNNLKTALVATQYFHVARTKLALERNGVLVTGTVHARYFEMRDFYSIPREVIAYIAYTAKL